VDIDENLIRDMQSYLLLKTGIRYFGRIKPTPNDIMVSCPFHKGGQERKPSCGIKRYADEKGSAGTVHCFSCRCYNRFEWYVKRYFRFAL